ncbi:MAG TPA: PepSY-associated TM helix domain-containing protein [Nevskia sp.]|nr:PepSY-associated TM helix domain-containing protein [Nevskia sp.]
MSAIETLNESAAVPHNPSRVRFIRWLRRVHGWIGLWGAALGLLFGSSGILLNHRAVMRIDAARSQESTVQLPLPQPAPQSAQAMAEWLRDELGLDHPNLKSREEKAHPVAWGERDLVQPGHWQMSLTTPRMNVQADWWVGSAYVTLKRSDNNFFAVLGNLHKGVGLGAPWVLLADSLAGSIILLSLTGVILWTRLNRRRLAGAAIGIAGLVLTLALSLSAM